MGQIEGERGKDIGQTVEAKKGGAGRSGGERMGKGLTG